MLPVTHKNQNDYPLQALVNRSAGSEDDTYLRQFIMQKGQWTHNEQ
ncbi:MAG: hypothetical protein RMY28_022070 [Nostoc sp. ChiSLP01]